MVGLKHGRRQFLRITLSGLGATFVLPSSEDSATKPTPARHRNGALPDTWIELTDLVSGYFRGSLEQVVPIGQAYMDRFGNDKAGLIQDLRSLVLGIADQRDLDRAVATLEAAIVREFAEERDVSLEGWQLAPTELRLCAVAVMIRSPELSLRP